MADASMILVTGATGTVGRHVAQRLADRGANAVAATRRPDATAGDLPLPAVQFDFEDPSTYDAFDGMEKVFLVRPPAIARVWESIFPALAVAPRPHDGAVRHDRDGEAGDAPVVHHFFLVVGFLGSVTTFSTFSLKTLALSDGGDWRSLTSGAVSSLGSSAERRGAG